jgi:UTP--glucose-1-phosphate uridylyltransferase
MKGSVGDDMKAVIPAAGLGLRFLPLTKEQPKEMLPVVDKPTIQYVVEEAVASGVKDILVITGRKKTSIEDHFDRAFELEEVLRRGRREKSLEQVRAISTMANLFYVRQKEQKGLGDAVLAARPFIGDEYFAVMLGDTINISAVPVLAQLMRVHERFGTSVIAVEPVERTKIRDYGIIAEKPLGEGISEILDMVEKPSPEDAPSNLGITGTYILSPKIFDCLERTSPGLNGELQLTDAMKLLLREEKILALRFEGRRYDIGDMLGWMKTQIELSLSHPVYGKDLQKFTRDLLERRG